jgi:ribosomal protein S30
LTPLHPFDTVRAVTEQADAKRKRQIGPRVEESLTKDVRILAIRQERRFNDLIEEALRDLLKKYQAKKGHLLKGKG